MQRNDVRYPVEITCCKVNEILNDEKRCKEISTNLKPTILELISCYTIKRRIIIFSCIDFRFPNKKAKKRRKIKEKEL